MIKVKDEKGLVRDPFSKAIIRTDVDTLTEHRKNRALQRRSLLAVDRIDDLERDVKEIKSLLLQLMNKETQGL